MGDQIGNMQSSQSRFKPDTLGQAVEAFIAKPPLLRWVDLKLQELRRRLSCDEDDAEIRWRKAMTVCKSRGQFDAQFPPMLQILRSLSVSPKSAALQLSAFHVPRIDPVNNSP